MESYPAKALVCAAPSTVWDVITRAADYPEWDSGFARVSGDISDGQQISVRTGSGHGRHARVDAARSGNQVMTWSAGLPLGIFRIVRTIAVSAEHGKTRLVVRDELTGPLRKLISRYLGESIPSARRYAEGVRARAEQLS